MTHPSGLVNSWPTNETSPFGGFCSVLTVFQNHVILSIFQQAPRSLACLRHCCPSSPHTSTFPARSYLCMSLASHPINGIAWTNKRALHLITGCPKAWIMLTALYSSQMFKFPLFKTWKSSSMPIPGISPYYRLNSFPRWTKQIVVAHSWFSDLKANTTANEFQRMVWKGTLQLINQPIPCFVEVLLCLLGYYSSVLTADPTTFVPCVILVPFFLLEPLYLWSLPLHSCYTQNFPNWRSFIRASRMAGELCDLPSASRLEGPWA